MRPVSAREALSIDSEKMVSTLNQPNQVINQETGKPVSGVFWVCSMDEDPEDSDAGGILVTLVDATKHGRGEEFLASITPDTVVIVDLQF